MTSIHSSIQNQRALPLAGMPNHAFRRLLWGVSLVLAWMLYRLTMAPGILWGDSGAAQLHTAADGWLVEGQIARSHVLYFLLTRALHRLGALDAAFAANLVSTIGGALTVANSAYICAALCRTRTAAVVGVLLTVFAHTLWRLSVSTEVVTLTTALLTAELMCLLRLIETQRPHWLILVLLCNGLGVANHNFAMLMWPVYLMLAIRFRPALGAAHLRWAALALVPWLIGISPLIVLCFADWRTQGSLSTTLGSLLWGNYSGKVTNAARMPKLLVQTITYTVLNYPTPLLFFFFGGMTAIRRMGSPALAWLMFGVLAVYLLFGMRYDVPDQFTFLVPAFLLVSIFTAKGVDQWLTRRRRAPLVHVLLLLGACAGPLVYTALPLVLRNIAVSADWLPRRDVPYREHFHWFLRPWLNGYTGAERFARETLDALPPWAVLVVDSTLVAPLNYLQMVEGVRKDVRLDCWAARQEWLAAIDWDTERRAALSRGLLFTTSDDPRYQPSWLREAAHTLQREGLVFRVRE